jgi:hypothetical protein
VILDTKGNIFGGFTPVAWESIKWDGQSLDNSNTRKSDDTLKADDSAKSFLFTLKNPHNIPPKKFPLKPENKDEAIDCSLTWSAHLRDIDCLVFLTPTTRD